MAEPGDEIREFGYTVSHASVILRPWSNEQVELCEPGSPVAMTVFLLLNGNIRL